MHEAQGGSGQEAGPQPLLLCHPFSGFAAGEHSMAPAVLQKARVGHKAICHKTA